MSNGLSSLYKELKAYKAAWYCLSNLLLLLRVSGCESLPVGRVLDLMDSVRCSKLGVDKVHDIQTGLSGLNVVKDGDVSVYSNGKGCLVAFGVLDCKAQKEVSIGVNEKSDCGSKVESCEVKL
jgi:hypothetical protein